MKQKTIKDSQDTVGEVSLPVGPRMSGFLSSLRGGTRMLALMTLLGTAATGCGALNPNIQNENTVIDIETKNTADPRLEKEWEDFLNNEVDSRSREHIGGLNKVNIEYAHNIDALNANRNGLEVTKALHKAFGLDTSIYAMIDIHDGEWGQVMYQENLTWIGDPTFQKFLEAIEKNQVPLDKVVWIIKTVNANIGDPGLGQFGVMLPSFTHMIEHADVAEKNLKYLMSKSIQLRNYLFLMKDFPGSDQTLSFLTINNLPDSIEKIEKKLNTALVKDQPIQKLSREHVETHTPLIPYVPLFKILEIEPAVFGLLEELSTMMSVDYKNPRMAAVVLYMYREGPETVSQVLGSMELLTRQQFYRDMLNNPEHGSRNLEYIIDIVKKQQSCEFLCVSLQRVTTIFGEAHEPSLQDIAEMIDTVAMIDYYHIAPDQYRDLESYYTIDRTIDKKLMMQEEKPTDFMYPSGAIHHLLTPENKTIIERLRKLMGPKFSIYPVINLQSKSSVEEALHHIKELGENMDGIEKVVTTFDLGNQGIYSEKRKRSQALVTSGKNADFVIDVDTILKEYGLAVTSMTIEKISQLNDAGVEPNDIRRMVANLKKLGFDLNDMRNIFWSHKAFDHKALGIGLEDPKVAEVIARIEKKFGEKITFEDLDFMITLAHHPELMSLLDEMSDKKTVAKEVEERLKNITTSHRVDSGHILSSENFKKYTDIGSLSIISLFRITLLLNSIPSLRSEMVQLLSDDMADTTTEHGGALIWKNGAIHVKVEEPDEKENDETYKTPDIARKNRWNGSSLITFHNHSLNDGVSYKYPGPSGYGGDLGEAGATIRNEIVFTNLEGKNAYNIHFYGSRFSVDLGTFPLR